MGILRKVLAVTGWGSLAGVAGFVAATRKSKISPIADNDYIFQNTLIARYNPSNAPVSQDVCTRQVPLSQIKPELLEKEGTLAERFCGGVWGGIGKSFWVKMVGFQTDCSVTGYAYQRRYLERKYRGPETASQLWTREELRDATFDVGTQITDHFEVVSKTPDSIIVRCGDSPRVSDVRASDGLFEMAASVDKERGVAEFKLKSVFYNGLAAPDKDGKMPESGPMSPTIQWLHQQYDKILMESAIRNVMK